MEEVHICSPTRIKPDFDEKIRIVRASPGHIGGIGVEMTPHDPVSPTGNVLTAELPHSVKGAFLLGFDDCADSEVIDEHIAPGIACGLIICGRISVLVTFLGAALSVFVPVADVSCVREAGFVRNALHCRCKPVLTARISTVSEGIVQLNHPQKLTQIDLPILGIVIRAMGNAVLIAVFGGITVLSVGIAMIGSLIVKLDDTEQFREADFVIRRIAICAVMGERSVGTCVSCSVSVCVRLLRIMSVRAVVTGSSEARSIPSVAMLWRTPRICSLWLNQKNHKSFFR